MGVAKHVVKRRGHTESYDQRKVYASVYSALLAVRIQEREAELVAAQVCEHINNWIAPKHEVTSGDISRQATKHLHGFNPDAAFLYLHHRSIS